MYEDKIKPKLHDIVKLRSKGLSTDKIAEYLGIESSDLFLEIQANQELYNAWYKGEVYLIEQVENALYDAAKGHFVEEEEEITTESEKGTITTFKRKKKWIQSVPAAIRVLETINQRRWANANDDSKQIEIVLPRELLKYSE